MLDPKTIAATLVELGITHLAWLPDSTLGTWESALLSRPELKLVRVCREGEAWVLAAGLQLGGQRPLVVMQSTGLFDSGDALRNVLFDLRLPLYAMIGYRSALLENSADTARHYLEPILRAWGLNYITLNEADYAAQLSTHYRQCQAAGRAGVALILEGKG
jgi:sulfopyruvate decarboxylase TPP-binding subunit